MGLSKNKWKEKNYLIQNADYKRLESCVDIFFNYHNLYLSSVTDCPLCKNARGINKKEKFIEHLDSHQEMAMNHDMMFRKLKE